jgi:radical SAM protein with 4Fe4S-binding SPASM domain
LNQNNVIPNIITNGWLLDDQTVKMMKESGIGTVAISFDGIKETHDSIRCKGSFDRDIEAFKLLKKNGQYSGAITSINKTNLNELPLIKKILTDIGVDSWQLQICIPMGNMVNHKEELIGPEDIDAILDFCLITAQEKKIVIYPADCLGYYTEKEELIRAISLGGHSFAPWAGCNAGRRGFGILHNGDILGCTSIRDRAFIEGNIRQRNLVDIWNDENAFSWMRNMKRIDLGGSCLSCVYGDVCLGGCPNTRLTMNGSMKSENPFCSFKVATDKLAAKVENFKKQDELFPKALDYAQNGRLQEAAIILEHLLKQKPNDEDILALTGFVHFFIGNYPKAKEVNETILKQSPTHSYANKGLGLTLHKMGETREGIKFIEKAIEYATDDFLDPYYDLATVYQEIGDFNKVNEIFSQVSIKKIKNTD